GMVFCNIISPQILWFRWARNSLPIIFVVSLLVSVGLWLERFVIIVMSLHRDFLTSSWDMYSPTFWDIAMFSGTIGFFIFLLLLFIRFLPVISIFEMRELLSKTEEEPA
ncbi:MAG TPA: hypothetical protein VER55_02315, partial [Ardenticatenaceae bacterium]|nr:hypothetical protein [Ardenticatenaceae bacterium]